MKKSELWEECVKTSKLAPKKGHIKILAQETIKRIREFTRSQKELWQEVPRLAIEANGRTGFSDELSRVIHNGYWAVAASVDRTGYTVYVDCATGELISTADPHKPASDEDVLRLAHHLAQIDAAYVVAGLKEMAKEPYGSYYDAQDRREHEAQRAELRKKVPAHYVRTRHFMPTYSTID